MRNSSFLFCFLLTSWLCNFARTHPTRRFFGPSLQQLCNRKVERKTREQTWWMVRHLFSGACLHWVLCSFACLSLERPEKAYHYRSPALSVCDYPFADFSASCELVECLENVFLFVRESLRSGGNMIIKNRKLIRKPQEMEAEEKSYIFWSKR